ncbi:MAG: HAD family hydrolase [Anaerolineales bacterium]|nr:HAD family hydrolase [Anaerolineales bacterium]
MLPAARLSLPELIIFDKDGTLIEFHAMWSGWLEGLAARLAAGAGRTLAADYLSHAGYDAAARRTLPGGRLARLSMADFYAHGIEFLTEHGVADPERVMAAAWSIPDPVHTAHPITDLDALFSLLRAHGCRLAVATSDDHGPAEATLAHLGVLRHLEGILGADDGLPIKPAPDMVLHFCRLTAVAPARALVVGDSQEDLRMARAAGAAAVGVLTGITSAAQLAPLADHVLDGVDQLPALLGLYLPSRAT